MVRETVSYTRNVRNDEGQVVDKVEGTVSYNFPSTIAEAVDMWGEEVVLSNLVSSVKIKVQAIARSADTAEEAQQLVDSYVPGVSRERSSSGVSKKALVEALSRLSQAERLELLNKIRQQQ